MLFRSGLFELSLNSFSVFLRNAFLESLRSTVNECLCFLKTKTCYFTNNLDNSNLVAACSLKNYIKLCLLSSSSATVSSRTSNCNCSSS